MHLRHSKAIRRARESGRHLTPPPRPTCRRIYCIVNTPDTRAAPPDGPQVIRSEYTVPLARPVLTNILAGLANPSAVSRESSVLGNPVALTPTLHPFPSGAVSLDRKSTR